MFLALACGDGQRSPAASQTPQPPDDAHAIRAIDVADLDAAQEMLDQFGTGAIEPGAILYADLTGDQREEAVVPVTSEGTLGNIGYLVFKLEGGQPQAVLTRTVDRTSAGGLQMRVDDGVLLETRAVYGPDDPFCCPSQLRETTFRWDGAALQVDSEVLVQQDPGLKRD